jgi:hypothetical protein
MDAKRSDELLAGSVSDTEAQGWALFSILYQLEQINAKLEIIAGQSQPMTAPPPTIKGWEQPGPIEDQGDDVDIDDDTPPDGPQDSPELAHDPDTGQFVSDDPDTPENEHYEEPDEKEPGVAS